MNSEHWRASQVKLVGWLPGDEFDGLRKESQPWERKAPPPQPRGNCLVSLSTKLFMTDSQAFFTAEWGACFVFSAVLRVAPVPSCELPFAALVSTPRTTHRFRGAGTPRASLVSPPELTFHLSSPRPYVALSFDGSGQFWLSAHPYTSVRQNRPVGDSLSSLLLRAQPRAGAAPNRARCLARWQSPVPTIEIGIRPPMSLVSEYASSSCLHLSSNGASPWGDDPAFAMVFKTAVD